MSEYPEEEGLEGREGEVNGDPLSLIVSASTLSSNVLDLSRRSISLLPGRESFPVCPHLQYLYLEGNSLTFIPESLPGLCPSLTWLDLRNNNLTSITPTISELKTLRILLLEGNNIVELPHEIGYMRSLYGLSLFHNPLKIPPHEVVKKGTKAVLRYLRRLHDSREILQSTCTTEVTDSDASSDDDEYNISISLQSEMMKKKLNEGDLAGSRRRRRSSVKPKSIVARSAVLRDRDELKRKTGEVTSVGGGGGGRRSRRNRNNEDIEKELERERSKQSLDAWRQETARLQQTKYGEGPSYAKGDGIATQLSSLSLHSSSKESDISSEGSDVKVTEWTREYAKRLKETRENGGIGTIPPASSDLIEAELKLAEALAMRKQFETRHYRLRAFTGETTS